MSQAGISFEPAIPLAPAQELARLMREGERHGPAECLHVDLVHHSELEVMRDGNPGRRGLPADHRPCQ